MADPSTDLLLIARAIGTALYGYCTPEDTSNTWAGVVAAAHDVLAIVTTLRPMSEALKVDGHEILAWQKSRWGFPARWRVIYWSEGPHHVCYNKCWVCSVCTLSQDEDLFAGWLPMPPAPMEEAANAE